MTLYYCPQTQAFYDDRIHQTIDEHAIVISPEQHEQLLNALNSGSLVLPDENQASGFIITPPRPSAHHIWLPETQTWHLPDDKAAELLQTAKTAKLHELNTAAQRFIAQVAQTDKVPAFEIQTWALQAQEAKAWAVNPNAPTPILDNIATARGVPADVLKQAALRKTQVYETLTALVAGQRQALQTRIEAAKTSDELSAIEIAFRLPESGATA